MTLEEALSVLQETAMTELTSLIPTSPKNGPGRDTMLPLTLPLGFMIDIRRLQLQMFMIGELTIIMDEVVAQRTTFGLLFIIILDIPLLRLRLLPSCTMIGGETGKCRLPPLLTVISPVGVTNALGTLRKDTTEYLRRTTDGTPLLQNYPLPNGTHPTIVEELVTIERGLESL